MTRRTTLPALFLLIAAFVLGGCKTELMQTPSVVADGKVNPFTHTAPRFQDNRVPVFVASGRTVSGNTSPVRFYTDTRSREVRLGLATVEIGADISWDELVQESCAAKRDRDLDMAVTAYREYGPLWTTAWPPNYRFSRIGNDETVSTEPAREFVEALETMLDASRRREITIFVHGFNTKFGANLELAAEFWHYMARDGVMMSFDWPSLGNLFSYQKDKSNADFAIRQFRRLLEFLAANTSAERINIMAHSAGNPIAVEALRQLSLLHYDLDADAARKITKIGRVVLAAPDMDFDTAISAGVDGAVRVTQGFTLYASTRDRALNFASNIFGDIRLGRCIGKLTDAEKEALIANDGQWIDVTAAQKHHPTFIGHSYFHENPWVSSDILLYLTIGASPQERGLVRDDKTGFLVFPEDYEQRLPEIVDQLRAKYAPTLAP